MAIHPIGSRVLVKPIQEENKTKAGIILEGTEKDRPDRGTIVELGEGFISGCADAGELLGKRSRGGGLFRLADRYFIELAVGDVILFERHAPRVVKDTDGSDLLLVNASDILATIA